AEKWFYVIRTMSADPPGVTRASYSTVETEVLKYLNRQALDLGLEPRFDCYGNLWFFKGLFKGPYVVTGSHVDSVKHVGTYNGLAGVVAGILAVHASSTNVAAVALRGEESAWFGQPYKGSKVLFGALNTLASDELWAAMQRQRVVTSYPEFIMPT